MTTACRQYWHKINQGASAAPVRALLAAWKVASCASDASLSNCTNGITGWPLVYTSVLAVLGMGISQKAWLPVPGANPFPSLQKAESSLSWSRHQASKTCTAMLMLRSAKCLKDLLSAGTGFADKLSCSSEPTNCIQAATVALFMPALSLDLPPLLERLGYKNWSFRAPSVTKSFNLLVCRIVLSVFPPCWKNAVQRPTIAKPRGMTA